MRIDKYASRTGDKSRVGEHFYSDKAPFPTLLCVPAYWLIEKLGLTRTDDMTGKRYPVYVWEPVGLADGRSTINPDMVPVLFMGSFVCGSLPFACIVFLAMKRIQGVATGLSPVLLVMMSFYGSYVWVFAGTFFGHMVAALLLVLGYSLILERRDFIAGICIGLSFLSEYTVAIVIPLWALVTWFRERNPWRLARFLLGTVPSLLFISIYNSFITGRPFDMLNAYHATPAFQKELAHYYGFRLPSFDSLWGLSFSAYMGLVPHVPMLLFCAWFLIKQWKSPFSGVQKNYILMFSLPFFLLISCFFTWWGGWSYGPRYCICLAAILIYEGVYYLSGRKLNPWIFFAVTGCGLIAGWLTKVTLVYMVPDNTSMRRAAPGSDSFSDFILPAFAKAHFNANNLLTMRFDVAPATAAYIWLVLFTFVTVLFLVWHRQLYGQLPPVKTQAARPNRTIKERRASKRR